jgi:hypothetical protein
LLEHCPNRFVGSLERLLLGWVCKSQFSSDCVSTRTELDDELLELGLVLGGHLGVVGRRCRYLTCWPMMVQLQCGEDGRRDAVGVPSRSDADVPVDVREAVGAADGGVLEPGGLWGLARHVGEQDVA